MKRREKGREIKSLSLNPFHSAILFRVLSPLKCEILLKCKERRKEDIKFAQFFIFFSLRMTTNLRDERYKNSLKLILERIENLTRSSRSQVERRLTINIFA